MDQRQLQYFVSVVENGGFSRAAEKEFVSQTTISYHISLLEKELGVQLLERGNKTFGLTPAGMEYFNRTKEILNQLTAAQAEARVIQNSRNNRLRLGYFGRSGFDAMPGIIRRLREQVPDIHIELTQMNQTELLDKLEADELDGIFCTDYGRFNQVSWMNKKCLFSDPILLLVAEDHWAAQRDSVTTRELEQERLVLMVEKKLWNLLDDFPLKTAELQPVRNHDDLLLLVQSGYAVTMGASKALRPVNDRLKQLRISDYTQFDNNYFCWKKGPASKNLNRLIEILNCTDWDVMC